MIQSNLEKEFKTVLAQHPELTTEGIGITYYPDESEEERQAVFNQYREDLTKQAKAFGICCECLSQIKKRKAINKLAGTSLSWSERVVGFAAEHDYGTVDISQGVLIAAAIYMGFTLLQKPGKTCVWINASDNAKIDGRLVLRYHPINYIWKD